MATGKIHTGMNVWGAAMSLITLLTGAWLMVAPFALGYQRSSAGWNYATGNSFWFGLAIVVVSFAGVQLFAWSMVRQARHAGVLLSRQQRATIGATDIQIRIADLERAVSQLATMVAADLAARRNGDASRGPEAAQVMSQRVPGGMDQ